MFLYQKIDASREYGNVAELPSYIPQNLNPNFVLRPYQKAAFENFITHFEGNNCQKPTQLLFHMATGSGKTLIMAGIMLYLFKRGYRNFLFFVNLSNIVEKTKDNFLNAASSKFLFAQEIILDGRRVRVIPANNFQDTDNDAINICFTTTQGLHSDMWTAKENAITFDDFDDKKIVLISDEAHHLNVDTKKTMSIGENLDYHSWEETVKRIFERNKDNILLEFTATCDLANKAILAAYENKIVFDYPLAKFYADKYSKDIVTFRSTLSVMDRALQALLLSQYRLKVFQSYRLGIKPVVLFKASKIRESQNFMAEFVDTVKNLTPDRLRLLLPSSDDGILHRMSIYFAQNNISLDTLAAELKDDFSPTHCLSVNDDKDASEKQILLNSLEDADNPYRAIFEVKKLDEGWDVLNLFDIVRLYETRQSRGAKVSPTTIAEAQLIGRGARYCPFQIDDEQPKHQRKYDDADNQLRVCETLYYHCQNDHRYIFELKQALREIGLDTEVVEQRKYILKQNFLDDDLYKHGLIFHNARRVKDRKDVRTLMPKVKDEPYFYRVPCSLSAEDEIMTDAPQEINAQLKSKTLRIGDIAAFNYAIVNKALMKYPIFKFNSLKSYFPNLSSTREFITSDNYLASVKITLQRAADAPTTDTLYAAAFHVLGKIASAISEIKETYYGTKEFVPQKVRDVFRNKTVNYSAPHDQGVGISQNAPSVKDEWRIDLSKEDWFAYTDNFGTSEEKAFVAYFKTCVDDLKRVYGKIYLVRNERLFHVYSFDDGERFEPDYVLFLQRNMAAGFEQLQIFIEPKGSHLLEADAWKEKFLLQMKKRAIPVKKYVDDNTYRIWGLHFFNGDNRMTEFDSDFSSLTKNED